MGAERLENAAAAAGFAMVNPDDFAAETIVETIPATQAIVAEWRDTTPKPVARSWISWDYFRFIAPKATA